MSIGLIVTTAGGSGTGLLDLTRRLRIEIDRALEILAKAYPDGRNLKTAQALHVRGEIELAEGKPAQGIQTFRDALAIVNALVPRPIPLLAESSTRLGFTLAESNDPAGAKRAFEDAIGATRVQGADSLPLAMLLLNYGQLAGQTDFEAGLRAFGEAQQILERKHDERASYASAAMAVVEAEHQHWPEARVHAEAAVAFSKRDPGAQPVNTAELEFVLAQAIVGTRGDRKRARALAMEARATFVKLGPSAAALLKRVDRWLATRG